MLSYTEQHSPPNYYNHARHIGRLRFQTTSPRFMYANGAIVKRDYAIGFDDIRELVLHLVADSPPPSWLRIDNAQQIEKVVALLVPGLTSDLLGLPPLPTSSTSNPNLPLAIPYLSYVSSSPGGDPPLGTSIPFVASTFSHACPTRAPGDQTRMHSVLSAFFHGPVSGEERRRRVMHRLASETLANKDPAQYVLTVEQMIENDYPIPSYMADVFQYSPEWKETSEPHSPLTKAPNQESTIPARKIYALDCEMCSTEDGKELTRVCIVDYAGEVVYDQLVRPAKPVVDYLTRYGKTTLYMSLSLSLTINAHYTDGQG
jgi:RNA exonuclease 1